MFDTQTRAIANTIIKLLTEIRDELKALNKHMAELRSDVAIMDRTVTSIAVHTKATAVQTYDG